MDKIWNLIEDIMSRVRKLESNGNTWSWEQIEDSFSITEQAIIQLNDTVLDQRKTIERLQDQKDPRASIELYNKVKVERNKLRDMIEYDKKAMKELHNIIEELMNPWYVKLWNRLKSLKCPKISVKW